MKAKITLFLSLLLLGAIASSNGLANDEDIEEIRATLSLDFQTISETLTDEEMPTPQKSISIEYVLRELIAVGPIANKTIGDLADGYTFEQVANFSQEFQEYLLYYCLDRIMKYGGSQIDIHSIEPDTAGRYIVTTLGRTLEGHKQQRLTIDGRATNRYWVEKLNDDWRIVDIELGGVNVADNFHEQFAAVIQRKDAKSLLKSIREANAVQHKEHHF